MSKIRIGLIGLGAISKWSHVPGIKDTNDFEIVALCDILPDLLKERAQEYGVPEDHCFTDYRDLIACPDVDVIDISTPNDSHFEIAMAAAKTGKPFGLEKPITMNAKEAEILAAEVDKYGNKNMIYFSYRYKKAARYLRQLILSGKYGKVHQVSMQYFQGWGLKEKDCKLCWRFVKKAASSGSLADLGCHALDLVSFVTGKKYTSVLGHHETAVHERKLMPPNDDQIGPVDVDDISNFLCRMEDNIAACFQITRLAYARGNYQRMEVYCEHGAFVYHLDREPGKDELEYACAETEGKYIPLEVPQDVCTGPMMQLANLVKGSDDGLNATIQKDGLTNERLLDAILESVDSGSWVNV